MPRGRRWGLGFVVTVTSRHLQLGWGHRNGDIGKGQLPSPQVSRVQAWWTLTLGQCSPNAIPPGPRSVLAPHPA